MNTKTIIKIFKYQASKNAVIHLAIGFGTFILVCIIMSVVESVAANLDKYISVGAFITALMMFGIEMGFIFRSFASLFKNVQMGISRKNFMAGVILYHTAAYAVCVATVFLLAKIEDIFARLIYGENIVPNSDFFNKFIYDNISTALAASVGLWAVNIVCSMFLMAIIIKFGWKGFWVGYAVFMVSAMVIPRHLQEIRRIIDNNSVLSAILYSDASIKITITAVILAALFFVSTRIYMKFDIA